MAIAASRLPISIEQYLEAELTAPVKHEYVAGHIYAMVETSKAHNLVALALASALRSHLQGRPCQVFMADVKHLSQVKQKQGLSSSLLMATIPPAEAAFCAVALPPPSPGSPVLRST